MDRPIRAAASRVVRAAVTTVRETVSRIGVFPSAGLSADASRPVVADGGTADIELVVAVIRPGKLNDVKRALAESGTPGLTVSNVSGRGNQPTETGQWRGEEYIVDLHQKVKVEVVVPDTETEAAVEAIQEAAHTGEPGDGKIWVLPVRDAIRVSTDERGAAAV